MARIRCFMLEATDRVLVKLRRYSKEQTCPLPGCGGFHQAAMRIEDEPAEFDAGYPGVISNSGEPVAPHDDPRWPRACACGYTFQEEDVWQRFTELIYRRVDTGEETTLRDAPPGAMWEAPWLDEMFVPQGPHNLEVMTPGGIWAIDGRANNCTMPEDHRQEKHHCWVRSGTPPDVTAGKNDGPTCQAGAGSILCGSYHGFLRNGYLED